MSGNGTVAVLFDVDGTLLTTGRSKHGSDLSVAAHFAAPARASWQLRVVCCRFRHQHADTKRTHQKRHPRRRATHPRCHMCPDLQEELRRE
jgi:phosphoglycolate phosphatase-like HAD superfamily hydrolase